MTQLSLLHVLLSAYVYIVTDTHPFFILEILMRLLRIIAVTCLLVSLHDDAVNNFEQLI